MRPKAVKSGDTGRWRVYMSKLVSFVIPCYRSAKTIGGVLEEIDAAMGNLDEYRYEIILVND